MTLARALLQDAEPPPSTPAVDVEEGPAWDIVEEWGLQSFPASDPPANW
jgi:hypothetical protein